MRVYYVANTQALGGAERYLLTLVDGLDSCECRVFMPESPAARELAVRSPKANVDVLPTDGYSIRPASLVKSMRFYRNFREGIIHFNLSHPGASTIDIIAARRVTRCPIVITTHLPTIATTRRERISARVALQSAHRVIAVCRSARDFIISQRIPGERVTAIYNGISDWQTSESRASELSAELGIASDSLIIGTVARLEAQKGLGLLVKSFAVLTARYPNARLVIVGEGSEEASLKGLADELGVTRKVSFSGWRSDSRDLISIFDIFALPSLFESFPFTVVEAMMAGKPVVASDVGGVGEAVINDETGLLIEPGSLEMLTQALSRLLDSQALRAQMGALARRKAIDEFSAETMVHTTCDLYQGILKQPGSVKQK